MRQPFHKTKTDPVSTNDGGKVIPDPDLHFHCFQLAETKTHQQMQGWLQQRRPEFSPFRMFTVNTFECVLQMQDVQIQR